MTIPKISMSLDTLKETFAKQIQQTQHLPITPDMLDIVAIAEDPNDVDTFRVIHFDELCIKINIPDGTPNVADNQA